MFILSVKVMSATKVAISIDSEMLREIDDLVDHHVFPSRSGAFQEAVKEKLDRMKRLRLAKESAKLDRDEEQGMAEEGIDDTWPEY